MTHLISLLALNAAQLQLQLQQEVGHGEVYAVCPRIYAYSYLQRKTYPIRTTARIVFV
jgi:hypothetical protein